MARSSDAGPRRQCPWCSATAQPEATHCPACGAALAQRESIGDLVIPGVTTVDPGLQAYDAQPLRIPRGSPTQGMAGGAIVGAAAAGGPVGLAAIGGLAAVAAAEYLGAGGGGSERVDLESVGRPSEAALQAVERLEREGEDALGPKTVGGEVPGDGPRAGVDPIGGSL